jgi:alpha-L-rhamnosidase
LAFVQLELRYADGRTETVITDASWRAGSGPVREHSIYDGEHYDARLEQPGWCRVGFDDGAWVAAEVDEWDRSTLFEADFPPVRVTELLPVKEVIRTPAGRTVLDFGQNFSGWVRFTLDAPAGTTVTLHTTETLIHGEPEFEVNRSALAADTYVHAGGGAATWEPRFTFHGFRYVDVDGWPGDIDPAAFTGVVIHTDMNRTGWFKCSNELVNKFHDNVVWSTRGNFVSLPTDCPQRDERLGWTGDINAFAPTASFVYDVHGLLSSWLQDVAAAQRRFGGVPMFAPELSRGSPMPLTALWADVVVSLPWHLYQEYGDREVLARQYWSAKAYIDGVEATLLDERGGISTGFQYGDWVDPDSPPTNPGAGKTPPFFIADVFYLRTTAEMAQIAEVLGEADDASRYWALHRRVRDAFRREWMTPNGRLTIETVSAYSLAICFGAFEDDQLGVAGDRLASLVAWGKRTITTGFAGTPYVMPALTRTGYLDLAYRMLLTTECPSVLYPITMGATTVWERWDAIRPDGTLNSTGMTSLNHYALGAVAAWLHDTVVGIERTGVGYATVRIAPQPGGGLTHASGAHETPLGRIEVAWRVDGDEFELTAVVPDGMTATVLLPRHPNGDAYQVGAGRHQWCYTLKADPDPGYTLDTPIKVLHADNVVWPRLVECISRHRGDEAPWTKFDDIFVKSSPSNYLNPWVPTPEFEAALRDAVGAPAATDPT